MLGFKEIPHLGTQDKNDLGGQIESLTSELLTNTVVIKNSDSYRAPCVMWWLLSMIMFFCQTWK